MDSFWIDKKVLITGATSGLGLALARQLTSLGANVAGVARHSPIEPPPFAFVQGDVSDKEQIHRIHAEAVARLGHIEVLINAASALGPTPLKLLLDTECEALSHVLETNLLGPFRLAKLVVPGMILSGFGLVVNISSDAAVNAYPRWGAYSISKAALDHLTRIFQAELESTAVHFLALDPGDMDTPMHALAVPDADRTQLYKPEDSAELMLRQIATGLFNPLRRGLR